MRKSLIAAVAASCAALLQSVPVQATTTHDVPFMQAFECSNTSSTNVGKFVNQPPFVPLLLQTVVHGDTCGFEGATITNIAGTKFEHLYLQILGTQDEGGFGPYLRVYYNGGSSVSQIPIRAGHVDGMFGGYTQRHYTPAEFGLTNGTVIDHMEIIANPSTAEDGKCLIRQLHLNFILRTYTFNVIESCP